MPPAPPSPRSLPGAALPRRVVLAALAGPALALLATGVARLLPVGQVWASILEAGLLAGRPFACVVGALLVLVVAGRARRVRAGLLLAAALVLLAGRPGCGEAPRGLRVVSANVNAFPDQPAPEVAAVLAAAAPDLLLTIEQRAERVPGLVRVADNYFVPMPRISHGHAVHCRPGLACAAAITPEFGSGHWVMPMGLVRISLPRTGSRPDLPVCVLSVHGPPPAPIDASGLLPYMGRVADALSAGRLVRQWGPCQAGDAALVVGDFNTVPGSAAWRRITADSGLVDAMAGRGIFRVSWPTGGGWPVLPLFPIDHVLAGPDLRITGISRLPVPGSDHLALSFGLSAR